MNKKNILSSAVFLLILGCLCFSSIVFAQETSTKELELNYPAIVNGAPPTGSSTLPEYAKYIFDFAIAFCGVVGLGSLIIGGVRYLTSAGDPGKTGDAKGQITSALFGAVLLLGSVILFNMINPSILTFSTPALKTVPTEALPTPPIYTIPTRDLIGRLKDMAEKLKEVPEAIRSTANEIQTLTGKCDCQNTQASCACEGDDAKKAKCKPKTCFAGGSSHPCKDMDKIALYQKNIIDDKDLALYYRERITAERADLLNDIQNIIMKNIAWYDTEIAKISSESKTSLQESLLTMLKNQKTVWEDERENKLKLAILLEMLSSPIAQIAQPAEKLSALPNQCMASVGQKCQASCKQGSDYGCHDKVKGCMPDKCSGGNPCPTSEIQSEVAKITAPYSQIISLCEAIISTVDSIKKERQVNSILY